MTRKPRTGEHKQTAKAQNYTGSPGLQTFPHARAPISSALASARIPARAGSERNAPNHRSFPGGPPQEHMDDGLYKIGFRTRLGTGDGVVVLQSGRIAAATAAPSIPGPTRSKARDLQPPCNWIAIP